MEFSLFFGECMLFSSILSFLVVSLISSLAFAQFFHFQKRKPLKIPFALTDSDLYVSWCVFFLVLVRQSFAEVHLSIFLSSFSLLLSPAQAALCMFYMCLINGSMDDLCITFFFPGRYIFVLIRMKIHANFSFFLLALGFDGSKHLLCLCLFAPFFCLQNLSSGEII